MAFTDDFDFAGAPADGFDCDNSADWSTTGSPQGVTLSTDTIAGNRVQGTAAVGIRCSNTTAGIRSCFNDLSAGSRFKITEKTLNIFFKYSKGKGPAYLTNTGTAVVARLFFGGTTDWADYRLTATGDSELRFGYQLLQCSGRNLRGGATSGTWSNTAANWDRDIHRIEIRLDFASTNNDTTADPPLFIDCIFVGTKIVVSEGTAGGTPTTLEALFDYAKIGGTRTGFPLGLVDVDETLARIRCSLDIGNGSNGANNEGYLKVTEKNILFDQFSAQVKHNLTVKNFSQLDFGESEVVSGVTGNNTVAVRGCQIVMPEDLDDEISTTLPAASDIIVENGGELNILDSKAIRWRDIELGAASDTSSVVQVNNVRFDTCQNVKFRANTLDIRGLVEIYNSTNLDASTPQAGEMTVTPDSCEDLLVHDCDEGIHFRSTLSITNYRAQDNTNFDLGILEGEVVDLIDGFYDRTKVRRLTA